MKDEKAELLKQIERLARHLTEDELDLAIGFVSKLKSNEFTSHPNSKERRTADEQSGTNNTNN